MDRGRYCIVRRDDTSSVDDCHARQLACLLIQNTPQLEHLEGDAYYALEDAFTKIINSFKPFPYEDDL